MPDGKFADNLGNVGVIDCNYLEDYFSTSLKQSINKLRKNKEFINNIYNKFEAENINLFALPELNFCEYA